MDIFQAIILGIVEGITEFLPISSTGHLILTANFMGIKQTDFVKTFEIVIQSGAILSVIFLYGRSLINNIELLKRIFVAFIPTAIIGFVLYKVIKQYLIGNPDIVLASLLVGGVALIGVELLFKTRRKKNNLRPEDEGLVSYERAFVIGVFQSVAVIPGVSRSASTIIGGMLLGLSRKNATEFSFLLAVPTMIAATAFDLKETSFNFNASELAALAVGFITSFIVAILAIKWLVQYVRSNDFIPFGIYRIVIAVIYFLMIV